MLKHESWALWRIQAFVLLGLVLPYSASAAATSSPKNPCEGFFEGDFVGARPGNPLLERSTLDHGALPFDRIQTSDFQPALDQAFKLAEGNLKAAKENGEAPTYKNVIEALEAVDLPLARVFDVFINLLEANSSPQLDALSEKYMPRLAQFTGKMYSDPKLFTRVEAIYLQRTNLGLNLEQNRLVEKIYRSFIQHGAKLTAKKQERIREIDQRLSVLEQVFRQNVSASVKAFEMVITDPKDLAGLPKHVVDAAAAEAKSRNHSGAWVFTLQVPSRTAFLKFAENRDLREKLWREDSQKGQSPDADKRPIVVEMARLRQERARLIGYKSHADAVTADRMAGSLQNVESFLKGLANAYLPAARREFAELQALAGHELKPWDIEFYIEKLKSQKFNFSEEELRPYFQLDQVLKGAFFAAQKLHGVSFRERPDLPVWHPTVRAFEVNDAKGNHLGLFYLDPFPRDHKGNGAWKDQFIKGGLANGVPMRSHVVNEGNFTPPVGNTPSLLTPREAITVFHEAGHALHELLSQAKYRTFFGTRVSKDFVEFPSQLFEKWAFEPEVLAMYARHYQTGELVPADLLAKFQAAQNFMAGWTGLRQVMFGLTDLAWHGKRRVPELSPEEARAWEHRALAPYRLLPAEGAFISPQFSHLFAGEYSAGYYSYKWADALVADAYDAFRVLGPFNPELARKLREELLEIGGSDDPAIRYRRFRGQEPDPNALLRSEGLLNPP